MAGYPGIEPGSPEIERIAQAHFGGLGRDELVRVAASDTSVLRSIVRSASGEIDMQTNNESVVIGVGGMAAQRLATLGEGSPDEPSHIAEEREQLKDILFEVSLCDQQP